MTVLYTIGHSTHSIERFIDLLSLHAVSAVADVRSSPYSRHTPQFNREPLQKALGAAGMEYVFLGNELGARPADTRVYRDGRVQFHLVAASDAFRKGIERLRAGMQSFRVALLCAEKDPLACHRTILVCRSLRHEGIAIQHILEDGGLESIAAAERRLMLECAIHDNDLFASADELVERAYDIRENKIAHTEKNNE